ncbi:hypothetical protein DYU11_19990 [Fibrisoma montanum]|uniref:Right handed beta helix domain-containing protein n=1 Tax=Fibrisoma montanum TaxID=2305895 RepID=A0A418M3D6_9BACT|nr:right-handed parallel beta-helix repeat-containing protein [Fibrisoma montanum]RIV20335.1 hypothetical protein DYU11_19990 [Fibrisoma montanum]
MKRLFALFSLLLTLSSTVLAQGSLWFPDTSGRYRPRYPDAVEPSYLGGWVWLKPSSGPSFPLLVDTTYVKGLPARLAVLQDRFRSTVQPIPLSTVRANTTNTLPTVITVADDGGAGLFQRDDSDPGATDNGVTIIRTAANVVYKRVAYDFINANWTCRGDAVTDDTANFLKLFTLMGKSRTIYVPPGIYRFSYPVEIPDGVKIICDPAATFRPLTEYPALFIRGNNGRYVFVPGNDVTIDGGIYDLRSYTMGGINIIAVKNVKVRAAVIHGWAGATFGVGIAGADNTEVTGCLIYNGDHAINAYASTRTLISHCVINECFSGIYGAVTERMTVASCIVTNVEDVAFDSEHGRYNLFYGCHAEGAKQGEYTLYSGGVDGNGRGTMHDLFFVNNTARRVAQYIKNYDSSGNPVYEACNPDAGAFTVHSLDTAAYNVGFIGNKVLAEFGYGFVHMQLLEHSARQVIVADNRITTQNGGKFFRILNSDGLELTRNTFTDLGGGEATENEFRDAHRAIITDNTFTYRTAKTSGYALLFNAIGVETSPGSNTYQPFGTVGGYIARNTFRGCGVYALRVDMFRSTSLRPTVEANTLSEGYISNGGLSIGNGTIIARNQNLKLLMPPGVYNAGAAPALNGSGAGKAVGNFGMGREGYNGLVGTIYFVPGSGWFSSTVNTVGGLSLTASGDNVTVSDGTSTGINAYVDIVLNSY